MGTILALLAAVSFATLGVRAKYHHYDDGDRASSQTALLPPPQTYCYTSVQTLHSEQPIAECFSVADGLFTAVTTPELKGRAQDATTTTDGYVIPGLWDGHGHLVEYGEMLLQVDLFGAATLDDVRARLRDHVEKHPGSGTKERWVRGMGWDQTDFGRMPTAVRGISPCPSSSSIPIFPL